MNTRSTSGKVAVNVPKLFHLCSVVVRGQWSVTYKVTRAGGECGLPVCFVDLIGSAKRTRTCMCSVGPYAIIVRARKWLSLNSNKLAVTIYVVLILIGRLSELSGHKLRFVCPLHLATKPNEPSGIGTAPYYSMCNLLYEPISYWMTCCSPTHSQHCESSLRLSAVKIIIVIIIWSAIYPASTPPVIKWNRFGQVTKKNTKKYVLKRLGKYQYWDIVTNLIQNTICVNLTHQ